MLKIGHRGAAGHAVENTMASFEKALEMGVDAIEFDVRRGPGGLCVFHDPTLKRMTGGVDDREIWSVPDVDYSVRIIGGETIPSFSEVLDRLGHRTTLNIELKEDGIAERVLEMVIARNLADSVIVSAFDDSDNEPGDTSNWVDLLWMKRQEPRLKIALLVEKEVNLHRAISVSMAYDIHAVAIAKSLAGSPNIFLLKGIPTHPNIFIWTVNNVDEMKYLNEVERVDGIFSDYPDRFKEAGIN